MSAMNAFPAGTRVYFHDASGRIGHGTVQSTNQLGDGSQIAVIKVDGAGNIIELPIAAISRAG